MTAIHRFSMRIKDKTICTLRDAVYNPFLCGFIPVSLLLTFLPTGIKYQCAMSNHHLMSTLLPALFIHVNLMHWLINIVFASILVYVCKRLSGYSSLLLTSVFIVVGLLSGLCTGIYLEPLGIHFAVLGCSGGVIGLLGLCLVLLAERLMDHKHVRHLGWIVILFIATAMAYLDPSNMATVLGATSFVVHLLGLLLGMLSGVIVLLITFDRKLRKWSLFIFCQRHE